MMSGKENLRKFRKTNKEDEKMRVGYMTNGFGPLVGDGAGVTSVKDIRYLTMGDDEEILKRITEIGFKSIEVL